MRTGWEGRHEDMKKETTIEFEAGDGVEKRFIGKRYRLSACVCGEAGKPIGCVKCAFRRSKRARVKQMTAACRLAPDYCALLGLYYVEDAP